MSNRVDELVRIMPPPKTPWEIEGDWATVERALGTPVPTDFKDFVSRYGTGQISWFLYVLNPFSENAAINLLDYNHLLLSQYRRPRHAGGCEEWAFFPERDGLLLWGYTDNGDEFYWATGGEPDTWNTVVYSRGEGKFTAVPQCTFSDCLVRQLTESGKEQPLESVNFDEPVFSQFSVE